MLESYYNTKTLDYNRREPRSNYMTWNQKKEVMKDINANALVLLEFYYSKSGYEYDYSDERVANALDWSATKVRDYRLKLEKHGYFKQTIIKNSKAISYNTTLGHERWGNNK